MINLTKNEMKKCFVITPIGSETDKIRRHIDGIIDASIRPALGANYQINVAHKISITGSITKQIINEIYSSDLVIANLTNKNPNVMYELAFRHCLGKPVIMIAEKGTDLPFDLISERTIFYENDAKGVLELRDELIKFEKTIDSEKVTSPIHELLDVIIKDENIIKIAKQNDNSGNTDAFQYIIDRLDKLDSIIPNNKTSDKTNEYDNWKFIFKYSEELSEKDLEKLNGSLIFELDIQDCDLVSLYNNHKENSLDIFARCPSGEIVDIILHAIQNAIFTYGIKIDSIEYFKL